MDFLFTMASVVNGSFPSPGANAGFTSVLKAEDAGILSHVYHGLSGWSVALTLIMILVAYDQCKRFAAVIGSVALRAR